MCVCVCVCVCMCVCVRVCAAFFENNCSSALKDKRHRRRNHSDIMYLPNSSGKMSTFKRKLTGLNSDFTLKTGCLIKVKN